MKKNVILRMLDHIEEQRELNKQLVAEAGRIRLPDPCTLDQLLEVWHRIRWSGYLEEEEIMILVDLHERDEEAREAINRLIMKCHIPLYDLFRQNRYDDIRLIMNSDDDYEVIEEETNND